MGTSLVEWNCSEETAIRKWISLFAGVGVWLVGIALEILREIFPHKFESRPIVVTVLGCLALGAALLLVAFGMWLMDRPEEKHEPVAPHSDPPSPAPTAATPTPAPAPAPQQPTVLKAAMPCPHFDIRLAEVCHVVLAMDDTMVRFPERGEEGGEKCVALYVINRPAAQGQQTWPARSVFASLEFKAGSRTTDVNRACWIGKDSNEITVGVNETEHVLVGLPKEDEWVTYHNPNRFTVLGSDFWSYREPPVELEKRTLNWGQGASYTVDVRIICNAPGPFLGETFAHRQFTLEHKGSLSVKMLEEPI